MNFLRSYLRIMEITILLDSQLHRGVEADGKHSLILANKLSHHGVYNIHLGRKDCRHRDARPNL